MSPGLNLGDNIVDSGGEESKDNEDGDPENGGAL
jgi:hypothetical protein